MSSTKRISDGLGVKTPGLTLLFPWQGLFTPSPPDLSLSLVWSLPIVSHLASLVLWTSPEFQPALWELKQPWQVSGSGLSLMLTGEGQKYWGTSGPPQGEALDQVRLRGSMSLAHSHQIYCQPPTYDLHLLTLKPVLFPSACVSVGGTNAEVTICKSNADGLTGKTSAPY